MYQKRCYFGKGTIYEYGNEITCSVKDGKLKLSGLNGVSKEINTTEFYKEDGTKLSSNEEYTIQNTAYKYYLDTLNENPSVNDYSGIASDSTTVWWEKIFKELEKNEEKGILLASRWESPAVPSADFFRYGLLKLCRMTSGSFFIQGTSLFSSERKGFVARCKLGFTCDSRTEGLG